jgi:hypothetical protein
VNLAGNEFSKRSNTKIMINNESLLKTTLTDKITDTIKEIKEMYKNMACDKK